MRRADANLELRLGVHDFLWLKARGVGTLDGANHPRIKSTPEVGCCARFTGWTRPCGHVRGSAALVQLAAMEAAAAAEKQQQRAAEAEALRALRSTSPAGHLYPSSDDPAILAASIGSRDFIIFWALVYAMLSGNVAVPLALWQADSSWGLVSLYPTCFLVLLIFKQVLLPGLFREWSSATVGFSLHQQRLIVYTSRTCLCGCLPLLLPFSHAFSMHRPARALPHSSVSAENVEVFTRVVRVRTFTHGVGLAPSGLTQKT